MGDISIKFGKFLTSVREEGVAWAVARGISAVAAMLRPIPRGDILFVAGGTGDSARYRMHHIAESLRHQGVAVSVTIQGALLLSRRVESFRIFVFHRPILTPRFREFTKHLGEMGKILLCDVDDFTFDADVFSRTNAFLSMNSFEMQQYDRGASSEFLNNRSVLAFTTSTPFLSDALSRFGKRVFVVPNRLSDRDMIVADPLARMGRNEENYVVKIGYFSGTKSHDRDFETVSNVLLRLLGKHQNLQLVIAGPLTLPWEMRELRDRIVRIPFSSREEHFGNISRVDINIAPLEIGDPFCESKSELKFFEAGIVGVPTVAASTRTFREAIDDGIDGYVASTEEEWHDRLRTLILDRERRQLMGSNARETALKRYTSRGARDDEYVKFLRSFL